MINELSNLLLSGALGIINFWILREMNIISFFDPKDVDEKKQFIVILGIFNIFIYQTLHNLGWEWLESQNNNFKYYVLTFVLAVVLEILICFILSYFVKKSNERKLKKGTGINLYVNTVDRIIEKYEGEDLYTYIFDFENKLIDHGYVINYSTKNPEFNLSLKKKKGHSEANLNYEEFIERTDKNNIEILSYIDIKTKTKIYFFVN